jgi:hypothetical protein
MNIIIDTEYHLPDTGALEFDYVYFVNKPKED